MTEKKFDYYLEGQTGKWEVIIGLEVHAQVTSNAKLFSSSSTKFGSDPNSQVSLVDAAMPGMLPVINKYCVEQAIKTGLGLKAKINNFSKFPCFARHRIAGPHSPSRSYEVCSGTRWR